MSLFDFNINMLLVVDIGNSHTVLGVFSGSKLITEWRLETLPSSTERSLKEHFRLSLAEGQILLDKIEGSAICSVVPNLTQKHSKVINVLIKTKPLIITGKTKTGLIIRYENPELLGPDRICAAVSAYGKFGGPTVVIDFGTATTVDVISKKGEFLGGAILPGVEPMMKALHRGTARLPEIPLIYPERSIGTSTIECLQSGILFGAIDAVEGVARRIRKELKQRPTVIATGGFASLLASRSRLIDQIDDNLVLDGARRIYNRLRRFH